MSNGSDNKNKSEPAIVRLDETAVNEARSILFHAYRDEPTFQYLFDHQYYNFQILNRLKANIFLTTYYQRVSQGFPQF